MNVRPDGLGDLGRLERQLAREDEEEVVVIAMDVRRSAVSTGPKARPCDDELFPVAEDLDPPPGRVADDLSLTRD